MKPKRAVIEYTPGRISSMLDPPHGILARRVRDFDLQDDHPLVHHLLCSMLRIRAEGTRSRIACEEYAGARERGIAPAIIFANSLRGTAIFASAARSSSRPLRQVRNTKNNTALKRERNPAAGRHLGHVAGHEHAVHRQEHQAEQQDHSPLRASATGWRRRTSPGMS